MSVSVRALSDDDLPAILELLLPVEETSTFLVGNAKESGVTDRGGRRNGLWLGAFEDGRLRGVLSHARGPDSLVPACGGYAPELVAEAARRRLQPGIIVGTATRVGEVVAAAPPTWKIARRQRETLMVLRWSQYRRPPPPRVSATIAPPTVEQADGVGRVLDVLTIESGMTMSPAENIERARRIAQDGGGFVATVGGVPVSVSSEAATTGRYVHVGSTATIPAWRRHGLCRPCVAAVMDRARAAGRASLGAVLFTGERNTDAIALYRSLGFEVHSPFELCFLERAASTA